MKRAKAFAVGLISVLTVLAFAPPVGASDIGEGVIESIDGPTANALPPEFASSCPELTDSVARLYSAFFLRLPDGDGWDYWLTTFQNATTDLLDIAEAFVASDEFQEMYGSLSNAEFVQLVYRNVLGRAPKQEGFEHWVNALNAGYARGAVMLAFSESEEYVDITETFTPLAGYLQWYTPSVEYRCGQRSGEFSPSPGHLYADVIVWNTGTTDLTWNATSYGTNGVRNVEDPAVIAAGFYQIFTNIELASLSLASVGVAGPDSEDFWWTIVYYPHPHAEQRPGYTD